MVLNTGSLDWESSALTTKPDILITSSTFKQAILSTIDDIRLEKRQIFDKHDLKSRQYPTCLPQPLPILYIIFVQIFLDLEKELKKQGNHSRGGLHSCLKNR